MRGFPKNLNSKEDYQYVRDNFPAEEWKPEFQALLDTMKDWFFVKELATDEVAPEGDTYKVVESEKTGEATEGEKTRSLYEYRENPTCKLLQLGFTKEEVEEALK